MPPTRYTPDAIRDEAPPRESETPSYVPRATPAQQGARQLKNDANPAATGETVSFDVTPKGSSWESVDAFGMKIRRKGGR